MINIRKKKQMDEPKTEQEKKSMAIKLTAGAGCIGGIGGIVFLGGALVAATLISAFAFKRRAMKTEQAGKYQSPPPPETVTDDQPNDLEMMMKSSKDHHNQVTKGLTILIPVDSSLPFLPNNSRNEDEHLSTENPSVLGEGVELLVEEDENFDVACDSIEVKEDKIEKGVEEVNVVEVRSESRILEPRGLIVGDVVQEDTIPTKCEDESTETAHADNCELSKMNGSLVLDSGKVPPSIEADDVEETARAVEKTPQVELSDGEESEDNGDEESSDGTEEDLSAKSNFDSVWPAESIQELSFILINETETNNETTGEGNPHDNDDNIDKEDEKVETIRRYMREVANHRSMETWTWLMLAMLWCLCQWYLGLPFMKVSILTMVISIVVLFGFPTL